VSRLSLAACVVALIPTFALADNGPPSVSPGESKPARFEVKPAQFVTPPPGSAPLWPAPAMPAGYQHYGQQLQTQIWLDQHNCAPDGCPKPIGCGNVWTEWKFIFGSCRQYFGSAESTVGHGYNTVERRK
jgi:hypothetical protein